jgi:hypothetical protein
MRIAKYIGWGILAAIAGVLFVTGYTYIVMYLWNWLVPNIFHGPLLTFWQAAGLILLAKLFVGFSRGGWGGGRYKHYMWKERMKERFESMTPEEKQAFKQQMKDRWGGGRRWGRNCGPFEDATEVKPEVKSEEQA